VCGKDTQSEYGTIEISLISQGYAGRAFAAKSPPRAFATSSTAPQVVSSVPATVDEKQREAFLIRPRFQAWPMITDHRICDKHDAVIGQRAICGLPPQFSANLAASLHQLLCRGADRGSGACKALNDTLRAIGVEV